MNKNILKGILLTLGILSLFGIVFAVGFHTANEITSGTFSGDYEVTGSFKLNNALSTCDGTKEGALKYNGTIVQVCDGTTWNDLSGSSTSTSSDSNTVLLLHLDGDFEDSSITPHSSVGAGDTNPSSTGKFSNAAYFDGTGDYIYIPAHSDFDFSGGEPFTLDFWVNINDLTNQNAIVQFGHDTNGRSLLLRAHTDGSLGLFQSSDPNSWNEYTSSTGIISENQWYHIAITKDTGTTPIKVYLDGTLQITTPSIANLYYDSSDADWVKFGAYFANGVISTGPNPLIGNLDEIRISNIVRWTTDFAVPTEPYS